MDKFGILFIVATPIGNLEDMTFRAVRILKEVALIACEDTRVTKKLLNHYSIETPTVSYFQHSKSSKTSQILDVLKTGQNVALVTDAGTPGVSDPGNKLVEDAIAENIAVVPIPGASALAALISVAGIDMQQFLFLGFPPHKKGRETFFKKVAAQDMPTVYYDSPHRVLKNLELLNTIMVETPRRGVSTSGGKQIIIGRELTKMFEEIVRGSIADIEKYFQVHPEKMKGEFTVIVHEE